MVRISRLLSVALLSLTLGSARAATDLGGAWRFKQDAGDQGRGAGWQAPAFNDGQWETRQVPGDVSRVDGVMWYRRVVTLPARAQQGTQALLFRQVDDEAEVYLDGELVATNNAWNRPFFIDLGPHLSDQPREVVVAVRVNDLGGPGGILGNVEITDAANIRDLYKTEWSERKPRSTLKQNGEIVMYSLFPRNFTQEGTFAKAQERLHELKALGVNTIWLLPIHEIGDEKRKGDLGSPYAIKDYFSINPEYGTKEDFRAFVKAAHVHGMRVIIDLVLNHTSPDNPLVTQHPDWFLRDENGNPIPEVADWWDIVDLQWEKREVWDYSYKVMEYWVKEFDVDGFRCDVASMVPTEFWEWSTERLRRNHKRDLLMLAESESADLHARAFDITYNWALYDTSVQVIKGTRPASALREEIEFRAMGYQPGVTHLNFVENHDKERAINQFGGPEGAKAAAVLTAFLPGVPLLYNGTEVGAAEVRNIFDDHPTAFTEDVHGMRAFWTGLLAVRADHPALQVGSLRFVDVEPKASVLAFERSQDRDRVLVVINLGRQEVTARLDHGLLRNGEVKLGPFGWTLLAEGAAAEKQSRKK